jgi:hypothetical protein
MSWRKCRDISESEKKKRWDCVTIQTRCQENYISKKEEEDRLRVTRKHTGTQEEEEEE